MRVKSILVTCCSLLAAGALSACSATSSSHTPAPSGTASAVTSPSASTMPPASTTPPAVTAPSGITPLASTTVPVPHPAVADAPFSTAAPSAGVPACTSVTTRLTAEPQQPANRNGATLLHFTNISSHPCTTQGHPGVRAQRRRPTAIPSHPRTRRLLRRPPTRAVATARQPQPRTRSNRHPRGRRCLPQRQLLPERTSTARHHARRHHQPHSHHQDLRLRQRGNRPRPPRHNRIRVSYTDLKDRACSSGPHWL